MKIQNLFLVLIFTIFYFFNGELTAQNVSINNTNAQPDPSAMLDISSATKGILIPRVTLSALTDAATVPNAATGLLVYNTGGNLSSGFYYNQGTPALISWIKIQSGTSNGWSLNGNQALSNDFIGTTNGTPLKFKVNGQNAGIISLSGDNVALGKLSLNPNTTGTGNVALGTYILQSNTTGYDNTAVGRQSLSINTSGAENVAIGVLSLNNNISGNQNTAIGKLALNTNSTGYENTALGYKSLADNLTGFQNVALGLSALNANTDGQINTAVGHSALKLNTLGNANTAVGSGALFSNSIGANNSAVGTNALRGNNEGIFNVAIGVSALYKNIDGDNNVACGVSALHENLSGYSNVAIGRDALYTNTLRNNNVAVGDSSLRSNGLGQTNLSHSTKNTAVGSKSLMNNGIGYENTGIGYHAMLNNIIGFSNTALGANSDVTQSNIDYATAIGAGAMVGCSNCLVLGGTGVASTFVGINNTNPNTDLMIKQKSDFGTSRGMKIVRSNGTNYWRTYVDSGNALTFEYNDLGDGNWAYITTTGQVVSGSDARIKKDIAPMADALGKVKLLAPKSFHYLNQEETDPIQYGFIAQDVESIYPDVVYTREDGTKGIAYQQFTSIAIQAIKEQEVKIDDLQRQIDELKALRKK